MDKNLSDVLRGTPDNYILPFYWQLGEPPGQACGSR